MTQKLTIRFQVETTETDPNSFEIYLKDLLQKTVLPALNAELQPLSLEVKKARN